MRTKTKLRLAYLLGALTLAIPPSAAYALTAGQSQTQSASKTTAQSAQPTGQSVQPVAYKQVAPQIVIVGRRPIDVLAGQRVRVRGRLLPAQEGRHVELQGLQGRNWRPLTSATTGPYGGFVLRYTASTVGVHQLRVRFANSYVHALAHAARLTVFQQTVASWYDDAGSTACGFHATMGVANKTLPCGTKVTFRYGGKTVTATVDDRGPFVAGRDWDLNQNTSAALGMSGVATVWSSS
jgi:rare lipoprotein A